MGFAQPQMIVELQIGKHAGIIPPMPDGDAKGE